MLAQYTDLVVNLIYKVGAAVIIGTRQHFTGFLKTGPKSWKIREYLWAILWALFLCYGQCQRRNGKSCVIVGLVARTVKLLLT